MKTNTIRQYNETCESETCKNKTFNANEFQNTYKTRTSEILSLDGVADDYNKKGLKTEKALAKLFGLTNEKIKKILEDYTPVLTKSKVLATGEEYWESLQGKNQQFVSQTADNYNEKIAA